MALRMKRTVCTNAALGPACAARSRPRDRTPLVGCWCFFLGSWHRPAAWACTATCRRHRGLESGRGRLS